MGSAARLTKAVKSLLASGLTQPCPGCCWEADLLREPLHSLVDPRLPSCPPSSTCLLDPLLGSGGTQHLTSEQLKRYTVSHGWLSKHCLEPTELASVYSNRPMELRAVKLWGEKVPLFFQVPLPLNWVPCGPVWSRVVTCGHVWPRGVPGDPDLPPTMSSAPHVAKFRRAVNIHFVLTSGSFCLFYFFLQDTECWQ